MGTCSIITSGLIKYTCPGLSLGPEANWHGVAYFCDSKYCWTTKEHGLYRLPMGNTRSNALITEPGVGMVVECPSVVCKQGIHTDVLPSGQKDPEHVPFTSLQLTCTA